MKFNNFNFSDFSYINIKLDQIIPAFFYAFLDLKPIVSSEIKSLAKSIHSTGCLNPPIVLKPDNSSDIFILISGYKRIEALKSLNKDEAICRLLNQPLTELQMMSFFLNDNISHHHYSILEISEILSFLQKHEHEEKIISDYMHVFNINPSKEELSKYILLSKLTAEEKRAVKENIIDSKIARNLIRFSDKDRKVIINLFSILKPSFSYQRIFLELLEEISKRDNIDFFFAIDDNEIQKTISNNKISPQQKCAAFKEYLIKKRRPRLYLKTKEFQNSVKSLKLPSNIKLSAPEFFEKEHFLLEVKFKNKEDLLKIAENIKKSAHKFNFNLYNNESSTGDKND